MRLLESIYEAGRQYAADLQETMTSVFDDFLHKWNYIAVPYLTHSAD